ncbi:hypothetical protein ACFL2Z_00075 [Candidatus Eisenbacteria bacterium]|uniref:Uncharacterized protein n=1 Tax=Eiseniibacteriota bacterium TaxID=2212470 RepID=A0ABV6YMM6_UNCEI
MKNTNRKRVPPNSKADVSIVTHLTPDLDACMAIWLLTRLVYRDLEMDLEFIPLGAGSSLQALVLQEEHQGQVVFVDIGGGRYDHHDTADYVCAASLVMKDHSLENDPVLRSMVEYALAVDHARIREGEDRGFSLVNIINGLNSTFPRDPQRVVRLVLTCLDGIYASLQQEAKAASELDGLVTFMTKWGRGAGCVSSNPSTRSLAHQLGYVVYIYIDPDSGYRGFTAPAGSGVDFGDVARRIRRLEPEADWFLHSSGELLLCGSRKAPFERQSKLSLVQLIALVKTED